MNINSLARQFIREDSHAVIHAKGSTTYDECMLRAMTEVSPLAYLVVDNRTNSIAYFNSNFCELWKLREIERAMRRGQIDTSNLMDRLRLLLVNADELAKLSRLMQNAIDNSTHRGEIFLTDGRTIQWISSVIGTEESGFYGRLYCFGDITQPKQFAAALQASEERYRQLFLGSPAVMLSIDPATGAILDGNLAATKFYGYTAAELCAMTVYDLVVDDPMAIYERMHNVPDAGITFQSTHKLQSGEFRHVEVYAGLLYVNGKKLFNSIVVDITERRRMETELMESETKLKDFAAAVPDISCIMDEDGQFIAVFGRDAKLMPMPGEAMKGLTLHQAFAPEEADFMLNEIRQTISSGKPRISMLEIEVNGEKRTIKRHTVSMSYMAGGKKTIAVVITDITEETRTERLLQTAYELRRRSDLMNDIISGQVPVDKRVKDRLEAWGVDPEAPVVCCLIAVASAKGKEAQGGGRPNDQLFLKNRIIDVLQEEANGIVWDCRSYTGVLCQLKDTDRIRSMQAAARFKDLLRKSFPNLAVTIGISNIHLGVGNLQKSYKQAWSAAAWALCERVTDGLYHYGDLGIFQLLANFEDKEQAMEFVQEKIGKLIAYDQLRDTDYLFTLEEILQCSSLKEVADKMFLHHKTLAFRKHRIEDIIGGSVDDFENRLALAVAVKLHKLNGVNHK